MLINLINTGLNPWLIIPCIIVAATLSWFLYKNNSVFKDAPIFIPKTLAVLRFLSIFIILFLLLSPFIRMTTKQIEKPILIFAQDNSRSIALSDKGSWYKNEYIEKLNSFSNSISDICDVHILNFGDIIKRSDSINYNDFVSDYFSLFTYVRNNYTNRNIGAMIVAGDGIYNMGINPATEESGLWFPVYTIGMGDTNVVKDIRISKVLHNKVVFKGNNFTVKSYILADRCKNENVTYTIKNNGTTVYEKKISITNNAFINEIYADIPANKPGLQRYTISVSIVDGEKNIQNNYKDIYVDVLESKRKILVLYHSPHPDIGSINESLSKSGQFETDIHKAKDFKGKIEDYQLIILHQIPSVTFNSTSLLQKINNSNIPCLYILGVKSNIKAFNQVGSGLTVQQTTQSYEEAKPTINNNFFTFQLTEGFTDFLRICPPLTVPFGNFNSVFNDGIFLYQQIKNINTERPLVMLYNVPGKGKNGVITGEGIWRWRQHCYLNFGHHDYFDEFISKTVQFLSTGAEKERLNIIYTRTYNENEQIIFGAEFYDENFQPDNRHDINLELKDSAGKTFNYIFARQGDFYKLNMGFLSSGAWTFNAILKTNNEVFQKNGSFIINPIQLEENNLTARFDIMQKIAFNHNGMFFNDNSFTEIEELLRKNNILLPISHNEVNIKELINYKFLFFVLIFFFSVEWFFRKFFGSY